jgi:hypothetical protein
MTERTLIWLKSNFQNRDPQDWADDLLDSVPALSGAPRILVSAVTFASATFTLGTVPVTSIITNVFVVRTTAWDAITTFEVGTSGTTDWLVETAAANVTGAIAAGEEQAVEVIAVNKGIDTATAIVVTLNQGAASAGSGYVVLEYIEEVQAS